jgi:hypothetical protein
MERMQKEIKIIQLVTWQVLPRSERKNKISCNKNGIKNTEMLENYIYCIPIKKFNKSVLISFCILSILMKNSKNKLQNSSLLNVMRNFDQSDTLPEFDLELFIFFHCGVELAR